MVDIYSSPFSYKNDFLIGYICSVSKGLGNVSIASEWTFSEIFIPKDEWNIY